jgi:hypothetical protein
VHGSINDGFLDPKEYLILKKAQNLEVSHSMDSQDTEKNQTMEIKQEVENTVVYQGKNPHEIQTQESNGNKKTK